MRSKISLALKIATVISALTGTVLGCALFAKDGYSAWYQRLFYFTKLSNIWILLIMAVVIALQFTKNTKFKRSKNTVYLIKYVFTVSIAITGVVFCGLLAPFAEEGYHAWSINSLLLHVFTPAFAVADFFVDEYRVELKKGQVLLCLIPPLVYFAFAMIMQSFGVDFGRGQTYPYFFLNYKSSAGWFGFNKQTPRPEVGSFYWIILCALLVVGIAFLLKRLSETKKKP